MRDWFLGDVATEEAADKKKTAFSTGDLTLHDRVGDGHRNREDDVSAVDGALSILGLRPQEKQEKPDRFITRGLETAIKLFQGDNDLKKDGWLAPGGETELALNTKLAEKIVPQNATINKDHSLIEKAFPDASRDWNHYQAGSGIGRGTAREGDPKADPEWNGIKMRKENEFLRDAETQNLHRFKNSMTDPKHVFSQQIKNMKEGETIILRDKHGKKGDYWDRDFGSKEKDLEFKDSREFDDKLAYGRTKIRSQGQFEAKREKDVVVIKGDVRHI